MAWPFRRQESEWQGQRGDEEERVRRYGRYGREGYGEPLSEREYREWDDDAEYGRYGREERRRHGPGGRSWRGGEEGYGSREYGRERESGSWREPEGGTWREREREPRRASWREREAGGGSWREDEPWNAPRSEREGYGGFSWQRRERGEGGMERRDVYGWSYPGREYGREQLGTSSTAMGPWLGTYGAGPWMGSVGGLGASAGFSGRGPSRYRRSDTKIYEDVNDRLTDDPRIDATDVEVRVEGSEVTLAGFVGTRHEKRIAEDDAEFVSGVKHVHNQLRVRDDRRREEGFWSQGRESMEGRSTEGSTQRGAASTGTGSEAARQVRPGMEVLDADGERIGKVKEVRGDTFHLDRPMKRDFLVPMSVVQRWGGDQVFLNVRHERIDDMGWQSPEMMGVSGTSKR